MDCLRNGGSINSCGCGCKSNIRKGQEGVPGLHSWYMPNRLEANLGIFSKNPEYQRKDGKGIYQGQVKPNGVRELRITGPYNEFKQSTYPNGKIIIEDSTNGGTRYDHPNSTKDGLFRKVAPEGLVKMFQDVESRFEPAPKRKLGGNLKKDK